MPAHVYRDLLKVMQARRGRYAGMDIPEFYELVEHLFTPEQATLNNALPSHPTAATRLRRPAPWKRWPTRGSA